MKVPLPPRTFHMKCAMKLQKLIFGRSPSARFTEKLSDRIKFRVR